MPPPRTGTGNPGGGPGMGMGNPAGRVGIVQIKPPAVWEVVSVVDGPISVKVVAALILEPTQVKVYDLLDTVVSMTPQGSPEATFVAV